MAHLQANKQKRGVSRQQTGQTKRQHSQSGEQRQGKSLAGSKLNEQGSTHMLKSKDRVRVRHQQNIQEAAPTFWRKETGQERSAGKQDEQGVAPTTWQAETE